MNNKVEILEDLENKRNTYLLGFIVFFAMWQIGSLVTWYFKEYLPNSVFVFFGIVLLLGSFGWVWVSYLLFGINKVFKKHPEFCRLMNDERACNLRYKATYYGLFVTIGLSAFIYVVILLGESWFGMDFTIISGQFVAHLIWVIALLSSATVYYILSKDE